MNGNIIAKLFSMFTITVPANAQKSVGLNASYTLRFSFSAANGNYKDAYFVNLLDENGKPRYIGMLNPNNAGKELKFTAKSAVTEDSNEGKLFAKVIARMFAGEMHEVQKHGFNVVLGLPVASEVESEPEVIRERMSDEETVRAILH
jgi:hypothetical protein